MLKSLITYLNIKLDLLNYFDLTRCLVELKEDSEGTRQPVEYISNGNHDVIDWDEFNGVSYWRLRDEITSDRTEERKYKAGSRNNIETTVPLKLVFAVPRTKLTEDDAYSFDRIRQTMVKQFAIDDGVIKTTLQAESVRINVVTANSDAKDVWEDETGGTGTFEPKYETVFGSIDVDVVIISKHSCLPTECDDVESDILRSFDWCGNTAITVGRLTEAQQTCISDFLCSCPDATVQLNGSTIGTVESGATGNFDVVQDGSPVGSWNGSEWVVPSCADGGSISVSFSDSSPDLGDIVTITATPSEFTPDSYLFFAYDGSGELFFIAEQASNTFDWTVLNIPVGSYDVYVLGSENGTPDINSYGTASVTISASFLMDLYPSLEGWSQVRFKASFSSVVERIQRTSDNSESNFSLVGNAVDSSAIETFTGSSDGLLSYVTLQNGGGTDTQSIVANRPQVVNSGTVNAINGIPTFIFDTNYLLSTLQKGTDTSVFVVIRPDSFSGNAVNARVFDIKENGGDSIQLTRDSSSGTWNMKNSSWQGGTTATRFGVANTGSLQIVSCFFLSASNEMYINGVAQSASAGSNIGAVSGTQSYIGARSDTQGTTLFNGAISAILVSQSDLRSNRLDIESRLTTLFT